jgi:hypothetical protein
MSERATTSSMGTVAEAIGFTIVLVILAWAQGAPTFLVAIATITFGAALLLHSSANFAEYMCLEVDVDAAAAPAVVPIQGGVAGRCWPDCSAHSRGNRYLYD